MNSKASYGFKYFCEYHVGLIIINYVHLNIIE